MKELEYPFDAGYILQYKRQIRKELLSHEQSWVEKKIAILGGSTTANIKVTLELFLLNQGIKPLFYESEYNQFYQDAVFSNPELDEFKPEIVYVHTTNRNIAQYPLITDSSKDVDELLDTEFRKYNSVWIGITKHFHCPIIQNNFEMPMYRLLGNKDASDIHGMVNFITRLNLMFYEYAQTHDNFFICDINYISADYGLKEWSNPFWWYMYKYALCVEAIPSLAFNIANIIKSILGRNKKGFILDLDNTLWGGVVGDDGPENLQMGPEESTGQVFSEFQKYIKAHKNLGLVLCIDSKNDEANALAGLNHVNCELHPDDFICIKANWEPKDRNFAAIADEIGLLPESLVFVDDNPAERHIVSENLKGVCAPEIGEAHQYIQNLDHGGFFETTYLSKDDLKRNEMYKENAKRAELLSTFSDYGEYLDSLEMKAIIKTFESMYLERIAQLTNKSNQFNLTTKRYTKSDIESMAVDDSYITLYGKLIDKFGDNGVVSIVIGRVEKYVCHIELWLMSCRVLKRDMEYAMMDSLVEKCLGRSVNEIIGYYYPTAKNQMVKDFYQMMGFELVSENEGNTVWKMNISQEYKEKNTHIKVER